VISAVLFNLVIYWIIRKTPEDSPRGVRGSPFSTSEDLDFTDDCAAVSHTPVYSTEDRQAANIRRTGGSAYKYQEETMTLYVEMPAPIKVIYKELRSYIKNYAKHTTLRILVASSH
jgi:hypothetical protein